MAVDIPMPAIGEDEDEDGIVTAWLVDEGAQVEAHQLIATIQVEKVAADVETPVAGFVRGLVDLNEPVPQGSPICAVYDESEEPATGEKDRGISEPAPREAVDVRVPASPAAKRVARELGVDISTVQPSGARITEDDVRNAAEPVGAGFVGLRAVIARNMRESVQTTAPVTITSRVDVTDTLPDKVTARIIKATATALTRHPGLNGVREGDRFLPGGSPDIAMAIQTDEGLVAPVVRAPAERSLEDVSRDVESLAQRARARSLSAEDYRGATFTVTNLGSYGVEMFTPIINLPQIAILGVGAIRTVPGLGSSGAIVPRREMALSLTFDHAFVDGAPAAEFLSDLKTLLEANT